MQRNLPIIIAALMGFALTVVPTTQSHALTCAQPITQFDTVKMPSTLTPRGIVVVHVSDWKKVRDIAALVEVGKPDGPRWALEPAPSHALVAATPGGPYAPSRYNSAGQMVLRPVTPLPVGKRVMFAPNFDAQRVKLLRTVVKRPAPGVKAGWLVVAAPAAGPAAKPLKLQATLNPADAKRPMRRSTGNPENLIYSRTYTFEPAPPKHAVVVMVTAKFIPSINQGVSKYLGTVRVFSAGPKLTLHQGECGGNFPLISSRATIGFSFLDAEGRLVATSSSLK